MSPEAPTSVPFVREVYPYLCVRGAAAALEFYSRVFGAQEIAQLAEPDGRIAHAELKLGSTTMMLADERPEAGATLLRAPADQDQGERQCRLRDPFGHEWLLGHPIESTEEMKRRFEAEFYAMTERPGDL